MPEFIKVEEYFQRPQDKRTLPGGIHEYTRRFRVLAEKGTSIHRFKDAPGVPELRTPYKSHDGMDYDFLSVAVEIVATPVDDMGDMCEVRVEYSNDKRRGA